ncbi:DUF1168-domain-containing protein [Polychaeton citri CBS 116435]|uniref:DUF1168-domain-containing protein n=1 Tax=Polychaeton citri CBS 116435 TaxID=1314669 RepID=A0A9P4UMC8_9PEZI|nr:DUF1168-domain-containing protein [Polychaeton citri CBS 116435]
MSEPIPEAVPTSFRARRNGRDGPPAKRAKLTPTSQQSAQLESLFANADREIQIPDSTSAKPKGLALPPEVVANVQGSSAGAGSGEFHVYKASRRRENERLRLMDEEVEKEKAEEDFRKKREEMKRLDEEKLSKNRARRDKAKARKVKTKEGKKVGSIGDVGNGTANEIGAAPKIGNKKLGGPVRLPRSEKTSDESDPDEEVRSHAREEEDVGVTIHDDD